MSFTADIYKEIHADIAKQGNVSAPQAMRKITEKSGIDIAFAIYVASGMRAAYFSIGKSSAKKHSRDGKALIFRLLLCRHMAKTVITLV